MNDNSLKYAEKREKSDIQKWKDINWEKAEEYVNRLQIRIVKAKLADKNNLVKRLQYLLVHSFYAKAIAIKKVSSNKGKRTAGVDGRIWKTEDEKWEIADECYQKLVKDDIVAVQGLIDSNMEILVKYCTENF